MSLIATFDDRMNPIVVKELRQGMQSWFVVIAVNLLLAILGVAAILMTIGSEVDHLQDNFSGREIFHFFLMVLLISNLIILPIYLLNRMVQERNLKQVDLSYITTLTPKQVVRGKFISGMALVTLIYSVCLPFLLFTHFLHGYDIPTLFCVLFSSYLLAMPILMMTIALGMLKVQLGIIAILYVGGISIAGFSNLAGPLLQEGIQGVFRNSEMFWVVGGILLVAVLLIKLLEAAAVGLLSPVSSNRTRPLRVWASLFIVSTGLAIAVFIVFSAWLYHTPTSTGWEIAFAECLPLLQGWCLVSLVFILFMLLIAICEPKDFSNRILQEHPRRRLQRWIAFPFTHGASGGILWVAIHMALIFGVLKVLFLFLHYQYTARTGLVVSITPALQEADHALHQCLLVFLSFSTYALGTRIFTQTMLPKNQHKNTWLLLIILLLGVVISVMLISLMQTGYAWEHSLLWKIVTIQETRGKEAFIQFWVIAGLALAAAIMYTPTGIRNLKTYLANQE